MAFKHGIKSKFYWHATDMTPYIEEASLTAERGMGEARPLASGQVTRVPGFVDVRVELTGLYDGEEEASADVVWDRLNDTVPRPYSYLPHGDGFGQTAYCGLSNVGSASLDAGDDVLRMPVGLVVSDGADRCVVLAPLARRTADGNSSVVDDVTASEFGAVGVLHCTAVDSGLSIAVYVEHSANGSDWEALITFPTLTEPGSALVEVSGTVQRYVRARWDLTGSAGQGGTFFISFGRR